MYELFKFYPDFLVAVSWPETRTKALTNQSNPVLLGNQC